MTSTPTTAGPSRREVWRMFDRIAGRYDLLNHLLSMRRDVAWRKVMAATVPDRENLRLLDLATGTADVMLSMTRTRPNVTRAVGLDMSLGMLSHGQRKIRDAHLENQLTLVRGDACQVALADEAFDAVTIAFGIRNVLDVDAALKEMRRVLTPGGRVLLLEFSLPRNWFIRTGYLWYFRHVLPRLGGLISGDGAAYRYLNETAETFPYGDAFCALMTKAGFTEVKHRPLTFGIATLYWGDVR